MSNWAKLQEDLTGLPVAKRAKFGIHFKRPDGLIEAHFVGKPCHFQENGIWKPIDTALLATADGWYSSPHSDVVIHPDGRVRVKGSTYQQFTELPSAKTGKLVGDKIIRTFPGGEQWLIMKEDGFREEIHVNKQKIPVEKFIAKTTGNLPSKYKAHPITAEDAEGNTYEFKGNVAEFGAWLDKAVYPVVIDPDFAGGATYATIVGGAWSGTGARASSIGIYTNEVRIGQLRQTTSYCRAYRGYLTFDTSSIPDTDTVNQSNIALVCVSDNSTKRDFDVAIHKYDWNALEVDITNATKRETAYDGLKASAADAAIWRNTSGMSVNTQYTSGNLSTAWVSKTGKTYYGFMSSYDVANSDIPDTGEANEYINIGMPDHATVGYRPVLTVLYSASGIPKHFMYYQRMRG